MFGNHSDDFSTILKNICRFNAVTDKKLLLPRKYLPSFTKALHLEITFLLKKGGSTLYRWGGGKQSTISIDYTPVDTLELI